MNPDSRIFLDVDSYVFDLQKTTREKQIYWKIMYRRLCLLQSRNFQPIILPTDQVRLHCSVGLTQPCRQTSPDQNETKFYRG